MNRPSFKSPICPTCGCSLVRLGISQEKAVCYHYHDQQYWFCCAGCLELFKTNSKSFLNETSGLLVCPVCLAEKQGNTTVEHLFNGYLFNFCRCPFCIDVFIQNPDYFVKRLSWQTDYAGIFGEQDGCCKTPKEPSKNNLNKP